MERSLTVIGGNHNYTMTFTLGNNVIESDAGFRVLDVDDTHIRYEAPYLNITLPVRRITAKQLEVIFTDISQWDPPGREPFTEHDKLRLRHFLTAAYDFVHMEVTFQM